MTTDDAPTPSAGNGLPAGDERGESGPGSSAGSAAEPPPATPRISAAGDPDEQPPRSRRGGRITPTEPAREKRREALLDTLLTRLASAQDRRGPEQAAEAMSLAQTLQQLNDLAADQFRAESGAAVDRGLEEGTEDAWEMLHECLLNGVPPEEYPAEVTDLLARSEIARRYEAVFQESAELHEEWLAFSAELRSHRNAQPGRPDTRDRLVWTEEGGWRWVDREGEPAGPVRVAGDTPARLGEWSLLSVSDNPPSLRFSARLSERDAAQPGPTLDVTVLPAIRGGAGARWQVRARLAGGPPGGVAIAVGTDPGVRAGSDFRPADRESEFLVDPPAPGRSLWLHGRWRRAAGAQGGGGERVLELPISLAPESD